MRREAAGFGIELLEGSLFDAAEVSLETRPAGQKLEAVVSVSGARYVKALYLELLFDSSRWSIEEYSCGKVFGDAETLELTALKAPGTLHHGQVLAGWPERKGFSGGGLVAVFTFKPNGAASPESGITGVPQSRRTSGVPTTGQASHYLNFSPGSSVFLWYYVNPGDYDQNGEVGITDLTPLGANFNDEGPFPVPDARSVVDGDANDVINIADITPIGLNFGNSIDGFAVYGSSSAGDYPASNSGPNGAGARLAGSRLFSLAKGGGTARKYWDMVMEVPVIGEGYYWQRPQFGGSSGTPSQLVSHKQEWHVQRIFDYSITGELHSNAGLDLADINGMPALITIGRSPANQNYFNYTAASDPAGQNWRPSVQFMQLSGSQVAPRMAEINGKPAFLWRDDSVGEGLFYMAALNAEGTSWLPQTKIENNFDAGINKKLLEYDGAPVAVYTNGAEQVRMSLATDSGGTGWSTPEVIYSSADVYRFSAASTTGGIAVVADSSTVDSLVYRFVSIEGTVLTPHTPVQLTPDFVGSGVPAEIGFAGGSPYAIKMLGAGNLNYAFGLDGTGESWTVMSPINQRGSSTHFFESITAYGVPWVCYFDADNNFVASMYASEPQSNSWVQGDDVAEDLAPADINMALAGIHPAVAYRTGDKFVNFAAYY